MSNDEFNEALTELSECREDERNSQNQILQVISAAGTILGVIFGASFLETGSKELLVDDLKNRALFEFSVVVFCAAFCYIMALGIGNVLRYYHVQKLEDLLYQHEAEKGADSEILHWGGVSAPIVTRNIMHLNSFHTITYFIQYTSATLCAILFSSGVILFLYGRIQNKRMVDYLFLGFAGLVVAVTGIYYFICSLGRMKVYHFAVKTAKSRRSRRLYPKMKSQSEDFWHLIGYLIYPKCGDWQKPVMTVAAFAVGSLFFYGMELENWRWDNLVVFVVFFEFLLYSARYQLNDIRGIPEDRAAGKADRLLREGSEEAVSIIWSLAIIVVKIVIACMLIWLHTGIRQQLYISGVSLIIFTIIYEYSRVKKKDFLVFASVGLGYPLRLMGGMSVAAPGIWRYSGLLCGIKWTWKVKFLLLASYYFFGTFSAILAWMNEAIHQENPRKSHYQVLKRAVESRRNDFVKSMSGREEFLLRKKGFLTDFWNWCFFESMVLMACIILFVSNMQIWGILAEILILIFVMVICLIASNKGILVCTGMLYAILSAAVVWGMNRISNCGFYIFICVSQALFVTLYFLTRYQPTLKLVTIKMQFPAKIVEALVGEYAWRVLVQWKKEH